MTKRIRRNHGLAFKAPSTGSGVALAAVKGKKTLATLTPVDVHLNAMTAAGLQAARRVPRIKTLRRALGLTQEEFVGRYRIPLGTLRDWEQGRTEPDQPARAYLKAIAGDPEAVRHAHAITPGPR